MTRPRPLGRNAGLIPSPDGGTVHVKKFILTAGATTLLVIVCQLPSLWRSQGSPSASSPEEAAFSKMKTMAMKNKKHMKNVLLPEAVHLLRHSIPLDTIYGNSTKEEKGEECSCNLSHSLSKLSTNCSCQRIMYKSHKFGFKLVSELLKPYKGQIQLVQPHVPPPIPPPPSVSHHKDFRRVLVLRNIYSALSSGYLYHKSGRECWLSPVGTKRKNGRRNKYQKNWKSYIGYELDPPSSAKGDGNNDTMCHYMADQPDDVGMRAYIGWVFGVHYKAMLTMWAEAENITRVAERTHVACFEDLTSPERDAEAFSGVLDFLLGSDRRRRNDTKPSDAPFLLGHETSRDPALRSRLKEVIRDLDARYYNGELAWLDSVLPC